MRYYNYYASTSPAIEPLTLTEAIEQLNYSAGLQDAYITGLIVAARIAAENHTDRAFINRTCVLELAYIPKSDYLILPFGPISSVTSITYLDVDNARQTLPTTVYDVDVNSNRVTLKYNQDWPTVTTGFFNSVKITYVAGYGAASTSIPSPILHSIKLHVSNMFSNRDTLISNSLMDSKAYNNLLRNYCIAYTGPV